MPSRLEQGGAAGGKAEGPATAAPLPTAASSAGRRLVVGEHGPRRDERSAHAAAIAAARLEIAASQRSPASAVSPPSGRPPPGKYKVVPCWHYQNGTCQYGSRCNFAHSDQELQHFRALGHAQGAAQGPASKGSVSSSSSSSSSSSRSSGLHRSAVDLSSSRAWERLATQHAQPRRPASGASSPAWPAAGVAAWAAAAPEAGSDAFPSLPLLSGSSMPSQPHLGGRSGASTGAVSAAATGGPGSPHSSGMGAAGSTSSDDSSAGADAVFGGSRRGSTSSGGSAAPTSTGVPAAAAAADACIEGAALEGSEEVQALLHARCHSLLCPITLEPFRDPVEAADGQLYERAAIESWLRSHGTSPLTNEPLASKSLRPCPAMQRCVGEVVGLLQALLGQQPL